MSVRRIFYGVVVDFLAIMMLFVSGCATGNSRIDNAQRHGVTGATWGAVAGALVGVASKTDPGRAAALGALIGGGVGAIGGAMDNSPRYSGVPQQKTSLSFAERGLVVLNNSPFTIIVRVSGVNQDHIITIQSLGRGAIPLTYAGGERFLLSVMKDEGGGKVSGVLTSTTIRFPRGHYVGSGYNSNRNHKMLEFDGRRLRKI